MNSAKNFEVLVCRVPEIAQAIVEKLWVYFRFSSWIYLPGMASTPPHRSFSSAHSLANSTSSLMGIDAEALVPAEERTALLDRAADQRTEYTSGAATPSTCTFSSCGTTPGFRFNTHQTSVSLQCRERPLCPFKASQVLYTLVGVDPQVFYQFVRAFASCNVVSIRAKIAHQPGLEAMS